MKRRIRNHAEALGYVRRRNGMILEDLLDSVVWGVSRARVWNAIREIADVGDYSRVWVR